MNIPSIKTLTAVSTYAKELRIVLETTDEDTLQYLLIGDKPFGDKSAFKGFSDNARAKRHYLRHSGTGMFHHVKMAMADELCETYGVEYIERGTNAKSPGIEYLNAGDTYTATLLFVNGRYRVGDWGTIVERGNYA